ncbi:MAG: T9SS type A sorting domain-containing protein [Bacteroidales bacterium]|nr:T9SS type A sorting domain-containing protein [Bacteroidales bacterium]
MKNTMLNIFRRFLFIVTLSMTMSSAYAQFEAKVYTFTGEGSNALWSNPDNWDGGYIPTTGDSLYSFVFITTTYVDIIMDEDVTIDRLVSNIGISLALQEGKTLTVNDTIDWRSEGNVILEDGAQLVYGNSFPAIVQKRIKAYDADTHAWNLIASPIMEDVVPSIENGFLTENENGYALYAYNASSNQWVDFKNAPFTIQYGSSYLYTNALDTVLQFNGTVNGSAEPIEVGLSYYSAHGDMAGCNFIGNPLPCNALVDRSYYILNEDSNSLMAIALSSHTPIKPCTGLIVNAKEANETVAFRHEMLEPSEQHGYIEITAAKSSAQDLVLDNAILSFNDGDDLGKIALFEGAPQVFFTKENKDLAILSIDSTNIQPLKFRVEENGTYTLHFELKDLSLPYLHLIDNITGGNIDLLATPDYTFSANTNNYTSRFKLVFDPHYGVDEQQNVVFAYYDNGNIIINDIETCHGASLQIVDMTGRVIRVCTDVAHNVSTDGMAPGIYVLRLKTQSKVLTQKVMIP